MMAAAGASPVMVQLVHPHATFTSSQHQMFQLLSAAFQKFCEIIDSQGSSSETSVENKKKIQVLEEQWHAAGLCGHQTISMLAQLRFHIGWENMTPDQFSRFYKFVFHICKEPQRKHVSVPVAVEAWELLLAGRLRLLDRWLEFVTSKSDELRVINEDQWRQVLDFSRTVHEDLSNYDTNGAWAWILDEFVEHLRSQRPMSRSQSGMMMEMHPGLNLGVDTSMATCMVAMSPRCGSKRRSPDVDTVAQQLSNIPLPSTAQENSPSMRGGPPSATKRMCTGPRPSHPQMPIPTTTIELPMLQLPQRTRHVVRPRKAGGGVNDLVASTVSEILFEGLSDSGGGPGSHGAAP